MLMTGGNGQIHIGRVSQEPNTGQTVVQQPCCRERSLTRLVATGDMWVGHTGGGSSGAQ